MDRFGAASVSIVTHYVLFGSAWDTGWLEIREFSDHHTWKDVCFRVLKCSYTSKINLNKAMFKGAGGK